MCLSQLFVFILVRTHSILNIAVSMMSIKSKTITEGSHGGERGEQGKGSGSQDPDSSKRRAHLSHALVSGYHAPSLPALP